MRGKYKKGSLSAFKNDERSLLCEFGFNIISESEAHRTIPGPLGIINYRFKIEKTQNLGSVVIKQWRCLYYKMRDLEKDCELIASRFGAYKDSYKSLETVLEDTHFKPLV